MLFLDAWLDACHFFITFCAFHGSFTIPIHTPFSIHPTPIRYPSDTHPTPDPYYCRSGTRKPTQLVCQEFQTSSWRGPIATIRCCHTTMPPCHHDIMLPCRVGVPGLPCGTCGLPLGIPAVSPATQDIWGTGYHGISESEVAPAHTLPCTHTTPHAVHPTPTPAP